MSSTEGRARGCYNRESDSGERGIQSRRNGSGLPAPPILAMKVPPPEAALPPPALPAAYSRPDAKLEPQAAEMLYRTHYGTPQQSRNTTIIAEGQPYPRKRPSSSYTAFYRWHGNITICFATATNETNLDNALETLKPH